MESMNSEKCFKLLLESWDEFKTYYRHKKLVYDKRYKDEDDENHWICWNEQDITTQLSRFFYSRLGENTDLEFHREKLLNQNQFSGYDFKKNLPRGGEIRPDFIVTDENNTKKLFVVGEVKYFRGGQYSSNDPDALKKDIRNLEWLKKHRICSKTILLVGDCFHHEHKRERSKRTWIEINKLLNKPNSIDFIGRIIMCDKSEATCSYILYKERNFDS